MPCPVFYDFQFSLIPVSVSYRCLCPYPGFISGLFVKDYPINSLALSLKVREFSYLRNFCHHDKTSERDFGQSDSVFILTFKSFQPEKISNYVGCLSFSNK